MTPLSPVYPLAMVDQAALRDMSQFAADAKVAGLKIHQAQVVLDERLDGEPVTRIALLVDDPSANTWEVSTVRELRAILGRKATEFGLPRVSVTLIPKSEAETVEKFAG